MRAAIVLLIFVFTLTGCEKIMDYYTRESTSSHNSCRIVHYTYDYFESTINTHIEYNGSGNPVSVTYLDEWLPEGQGREVFEYDHLNRLVRHIPDEFIGNKRQYIYEGDSMEPLRDTATDVYGNKYVERFTFDRSGRIVIEEIEWVFAAEGFEEEPLWKETKRYYYDAHGNRQVNPFDRPWHRTLKYSDKPSLYSLHPTWQLIFRDYSKNNASRVKTYNEFGLPINFIVSDLDYWQPFFDLNQNATITYDCTHTE